MAEYAIFFGPFAVAGVLVVLSMIVWRRNLGPTTSVWVLLGCAAALIAMGLLLPIGIWLGDM